MHPVLLSIGLILIPAYGAVTALGVLAALIFAERTARVAGVDAAKVWQLSVVALFAAIVCSRLLLIALNWSALRLHPAWLLGLAMIHHPLLGGFGALIAIVTAVLYGRWQRLPLRRTADALAAPIALGLAFEQIAALLAGSGYGRETSARWAVTYTDELAARWSGAPLGVALCPVQVYAALGFLGLSVFLWIWLRHERQQGDVTGLLLMGVGVVIYVTEFWRDAEGRGSWLDGALDGPQLAAILLVIAGGFFLWERKVTMGNADSQAADEPTMNDEAAHE